MWIRIAVLGLIGLLGGCGARSCPPCAAAPPAGASAAGAAVVPPPPTGPPPPRLSLTAVGFAELPGWGEDAVGAALPALRRSCKRLARLADDATLGPAAPVGGHARDWRAACAAALAVDAGDHEAARRFFMTHFTPYRVADAGEPIGRFTGYYEPVLHGARSRGGRYQTPMMARPPDLVVAALHEFVSDGGTRQIWGRVVEGRLRPYPTRAEIEAGALDGRGLELIWIDDPVDVFFAEVQGSARVVLEDGTSLRLGFAGKNGRPYTAIGRVLSAAGEIPADQVSMQSIRAWLVAHPERRAEVLDANEAYVFFTLSKGDGPIGSEGVVLTPGRSLAVDRAFIPLGVPIFVDTVAPLAGTGEAPWQHLVVAQDTGGAILGPVRGDVYFGGDEAAADVAGRMHGKGSYYLLLPTPATP